MCTFPFIALCSRDTKRNAHLCHGSSFQEFPQTHNELHRTLRLFFDYFVTEVPANRPICFCSVWQMKKQQKHVRLLVVAIAISTRGKLQFSVLKACSANTMDMWFEWCEFHETLLAFSDGNGTRMRIRTQQIERPGKDSSLSALNNSVFCCFLYRKQFPLLQRICVQIAWCHGCWELFTFQRSFCCESLHSLSCFVFSLLFFFPFTQKFRKQSAVGLQELSAFHHSCFVWHVQIKHCIFVLSSFLCCFSSTKFYFWRASVTLKKVFKKGVLTAPIFHQVSKE